jgi:broad specificity phosphatase PhoE
LTEDEIAERFPTLAADRARDKWRHRWPDGESYEDVVARVTPAGVRRALLAVERTLVVAHQATNRVLVHVLGGVAADAVLAMGQSTDVLLRLDAAGVAHAALTELVFRPGLPAGKAAPLV